jgi:hypothetical protein
MTVKLNKVDNGYVLLVDNILYATDNDKLSKQNCDEIFGVVDVEKLAREEACDCEASECDVRDDYKKGFNKAMELNKDKVFTLEDIKIAIQFGWDDEAMMAKEISDKYGFNASEYHSKNIIPFIQSIQQPTEIEVEIEI